MKRLQALSFFPFVLHPRGSQIRWRSVAISLLILYLFLFSVFALYHVYSANELDDPHGCSIGEWIHLGHQTAVVFTLLAIYLLYRSPEKRVLSILFTAPLSKDHPKRGPPVATLRIESVTL